MGGTCSTLRRDAKCAEYFGSKSEVNKLLGRPRRSWKSNIRMESVSHINGLLLYFK
jgi:hypothetical protein